MINTIKALADIRCELQDMNIPKTGKNKGLGFSYYELADILPPINKLEKKHGVVTVMNYFQSTDTYSLLMFGANGQPFEIASCKTAKALLKGGANPIQEEGSMQTYIRRYLYMMGYAIVENDWIDCISNEKEELQDADKRKKLYAIAGVKGYTKTQVEAMCKKKCSEDIKFITDEQYNMLYDGFKGLPDKEKK